MRIKSKLFLEVTVLFVLIGMISFIAISNTKQTQEMFSSLSAETLPVLKILTDMRYAATQISAVTMEIVLIEDETKNSESANYKKLEENLEANFYKIEEAKELFNESFSQYSSLMNKNNLGNSETEILADKWNQMIITSNKIIQLKAAGVSGIEILNLNKDLDLAYNDINKEIDRTMKVNADNIDHRQIEVASLVDNTTWSILIALNFFIIVAIVLRYIIFKTITNPLSKIRQTTHAIAKGDFVLYKNKGNDEISELGEDINIMSKNLAELNKAMIEKERLSSIGQLASRLAHDIRNPLAVIQNGFKFIEFKTKNNPDEKMVENIERMRRAMNRITHQINGVLDFVKISGLDYEKHSLSKIIETTVENTITPDKLRINLPENDSIVWCDAFKLDIVFGNLLSNAGHAVKGDGEVTFRIHDDENDVIIEIEDTGDGIPEESLTKIFKPLFTTKQIGNGLGLSSCKIIVEAHEGKIWAKNNPTIFTIQLPKKPLKMSKYSNDISIEKIKPEMVTK